MGHLYRGSGSVRGSAKAAASSTARGVARSAARGAARDAARGAARGAAAGSGATSGKGGGEPNPLKKFGQHFLSNPYTLQRMLDEIAPAKNEEFVEIGPGTGVLTFPLSKMCRKIIALEVDERMLAFLKKSFATIIKHEHSEGSEHSERREHPEHLERPDNSPNIQLVKTDALKDDLTSILSATSATPATPVEGSINGQRGGESDKRPTDEELEGLAGKSVGGKKDGQAADALRVVGNLPYNISVHLIEKFLILANFGVNSNNLLATNQDHKNVTASNTYISVPDTANRDTANRDISPIRKITDMHFLVQKEIAQRLYAEVGDSNYGRLSIMVQVMARGLKLFNLPPSDFSPPPKVTSSFISLQPQLHPAFEASASGLIKLRQFNKLVTTAFSRPNRRMRNTLGNYPQIVDALEQLNLHTKRAKETSLEEFISITKIKDFSIED